MINPRKPSAAEIEGAFERFWSVYPSRSPHSNPKKPARQKFEAAVKRGVDAEEIIRGAQVYARHAARHIPDPQHVAMATTWLHQERWSDLHEEHQHEEDTTGWPEGRQRRRSGHAALLAGAYLAANAGEPEPDAG